MHHVEPISPYQTRFLTPGLQFDIRGIAIGQKGLIIFPTIDRGACFFSAWSTDGSLQESLASLEIRRLRSLQRTYEIGVFFAVESSYRMDRVAGIARLAGGQSFTGTDRIFVQYRDNRSPLGYDIVENVDLAGDLVVFHESYRQAYFFDKTISFSELVLKLRPRPHKTRPAQHNFPLLISVEPGLFPALVSYLSRSAIKGRAALLDMPSHSAFEARARRLFLIEVDGLPPRFIELLRSVPGVNLFESPAPWARVEIGFEHPIALHACPNLFPSHTRVLFHGKGQVIVANALSSWSSLDSLFGFEWQEATPPIAHSSGTPLPPFHIPLQLVTKAPRRSHPSALFIPRNELLTFYNLLYFLPSSAFASIRIASAPNGFYLIAAAEIEAIPVGRFFNRLGSHLYIPLGMEIAPPVNSTFLSTLLSQFQDMHVFWESNEHPPVAIPDKAFFPLSQSIVLHLAPEIIDTLSSAPPPPPPPYLAHPPSPTAPLRNALAVSLKKK
ncbi:MAG: hypothetical protein NZM37_07250 [Sandaracinaceae bacterium]|nr:hypothetical protein [Sandaracinaceae bacterium]